MRRIFADTSYWMALVNPRDQIHQKAVSVSQRLSSESLLTTEMVLVEVLNSFSDSLYRESVGRMVASLRQDQNLTIMPQTPAQFDSAVQRYQQAADKSEILTHCATLALTDTENIHPQ